MIRKSSAMIPAASAALYNGLIHVFCKQFYYALNTYARADRVNTLWRSIIMIDYREINRLKSAKLEISNSMIASSVGSSRNAVSEVSRRIFVGEYIKTVKEDMVTDSDHHANEKWMKK